MNFYKSGVFKTCKKMTGFSKNTSQADHLEIWSDIHDQTPLEMAKACLVDLIGVVPVDEIYSWDREELKKWRQYIKATFMFAAEETYQYRFKTNDKRETDRFNR